MNKNNFLLLYFLFSTVYSFGQHSEYKGLAIIKPCSHHIIYPKDTTPSDKFITITTYKNVDLSTCKSDTNIINFYSYMNDTFPLKKLSFYVDWKSTRSEKLIENDSLQWMNSTYSHLTNNDLCLLAFICKKKNGKWMEIIVNDSTDRTMWIETSKITKFVPWNKLSFNKTWGKFTLNLTDDSKIYNRPNQRSEVINNKKMRSSFEVLKTRGDWMKVSNESGEFYPIDDFEKPIKGWIKYKNDKQLIVDFKII